MDICGFQETKSRPKTENLGGYLLICLDRVCHYYGLGFAVKKDIEVIEASSISDRIAYIKIRKCSKWGMKSEELRKVFYRLEKKSEMVIINCYAPHMGLMQKNPEIAEKFYKELREVKEKFRGQDVLIVGDFNAKLGSKKSDGGPVGSHARGIRNENGDSLYFFQLTTR